MKILLELLEILEQKFGSLQEVKMKILQDDSEILEFLLTHKEAKERYFLDCKGHLVFKKDSFLTFLKTRILDSSYTKFSNKIGLGVNDSFLKTSEKVVLNFPFKDCVLKGGQSKDEQKIKEIFFNEILGRDEIDVLFSKKALCNFELITLQNLRDSSRVDSTKSKDSMKSPPPIDLLKALNPNLAESRQVKSAESSDFNLVDCHDLTKSSLAMTDRDASAESSSSSLRGDTSPKQSINETNLAESRRIERVESAESLKDSSDSIESAKNSNFLDCHESQSDSRNDGIGVDSHDWKLSHNLAETEANAQAQNATLPNFLIKGNNLLALHSLKHRKDIYGQVKLIYIDPPYNTGNDSFNYNDNFNHSAWLTFMKNRLEIAREFLREDGVIFVQCDDNEQAYLKVLMDEIFGRGNFVANITCKVKSAGGLTTDTEMFFDCAEYLIAYSKNIQNLTYNDIKVKTEIINSYSKTAKQYNNIINNIQYDKKEFVTQKDDIKYYKIAKGYFNIETLPIKQMSEKDFYDKRNEIFRLTALSGGIGKKLKRHIEDFTNKDDLFIFEYTPTKGKDKNKLTQYLMYKSQTITMLNKLIKVDSKKQIIEKLEPISNIFVDDFWQGISNEGQIKLKNGKKPEALLKRIIEISTKEGDLIMDFFAGSGTTLAVAHKMKRRWIGIEQMDYVENITKERLKKVIAGEQGGVSKALNFTGGGSFIYLELMPLNAVYKEKISNLQVLKNRQDNAHKEANACHSKNFASHSNDTHHSNTPCHSNTSSCHSERSEESINKNFDDLDSSASPRNDKDCKQNKTLESTSTQEVRLYNTSTQEVRLYNTSTQEITLESIYKDLQEKAFIDYRVDIQTMLKDKEFEALSIEDKKKLLYSILDSNMDYVLYDDIEDSEYEISEDLIALNKAFYGANDE